MMRSRPAPVSRAKASSSLAKKGLSMPFDRNQRLAARRGDEGGDIEPFVAMMAERDRPLADRRPDTAMDRLQPEAMLVRRPDFDRLIRMFGGFLSEGPSELFLKAASCTGVAAFGFFGRGDWIDQPIALSASQPRCGARFSSPSSPAMKSATFRLHHTPPSGGGARSRILSFSRRSRLRTEGCAPLWRRRAPRAASPTPRGSLFCA